MHTQQPHANAGRTCLIQVPRQAAPCSAASGIVCLNCVTELSGRLAWHKVSQVEGLLPNSMFASQEAPHKPRPPQSGLEVGRNGLCQAVCSQAIPQRPGPRTYLHAHSCLLSLFQELGVPHASSRTHGQLVLVCSYDLQFIDNHNATET